VREKESLSEDASVDQILLSLLLKLLKKVQLKLLVLLMLKDQEDLDQRELVILDRPSLWENKTMLESTLSEENLKKEIRHSIKPQKFKDLSPKKELEERS